MKNGEAKGTRKDVTDKIKKVKGAGEDESEISERIQCDSVSIGHSARRRNLLVG